MYIVLSLFLTNYGRLCQRESFQIDPHLADVVVVDINRICTFQSVVWLWSLIRRIGENRIFGTGSDIASGHFKQNKCELTKTSIKLYLGNNLDDFSLHAQHELKTPQPPTTRPPCNEHCWRVRQSPCSPPSGLMQASPVEPKLKIPS